MDGVPRGIGKKSVLRTHAEYRLQRRNLSRRNEVLKIAQSAKLADDIMSIVRREARLHRRSVAGHNTHWVQIGRAIENSGKYWMFGSRL